MKIGDLVTWKHSNLANQNDLFIVVEVGGSLNDLLICLDLSKDTRTKWESCWLWRRV